MILQSNILCETAGCQPFLTVPLPGVFNFNQLIDAN